MDLACIPIFAEILDTYYSKDELQELAIAFGVYIPEKGVTALGLARQLVGNADQGQNSVMIEQPGGVQRLVHLLIGTSWPVRRHTNPNLRVKYVD